jgi:hypothetical protein
VGFNAPEFKMHSIKIAFIHALNAAMAYYFLRQRSINGWSFNADSGAAWPL